MGSYTEKIGLVSQGNLFLDEFIDKLPNAPQCLDHFKGASTRFYPAASFPSVWLLTANVATAIPSDYFLSSTAPRLSLGREHQERLRVGLLSVQEQNALRGCTG